MTAFQALIATANTLTWPGAFAIVGVAACIAAVVIVAFLALRWM